MANYPDHPERKLTILLISTGAVFGFIGSTIGAFSLAHLSGVPTDFSLELFPSHPFLQIYGFIAEFIMGVAYSLLPRFKTAPMRRLKVGFLVYVLFTISNVILLLSPLILSHTSILDLFASFLLLIGSCAFAYDVLPIALRRGGGFPEIDPLMMLPPISLILISFANVLIMNKLVKQSETFSQSMVLLALLGFAGSMIYVVTIRSVSFRQCNYRKKFARYSWVLQSIGIGATFLSIVFPIPGVDLAGGLFFVAAAFDVILTIRIFEFAHPIMYRPAMTKAHFALVRYNEVCLASGYAWLLIGCVLGVLSILGTAPLYSFFLRDSFIHSLAIGFIGSAIICFAPMLLPSLLGKKAPVTGLSFLPIMFLNMGMIIRLLGNAFTATSPSLPIWESLSGPLIITAMISFVVMLPRVGRKLSEKPVEKAIVSSQAVSPDELGNERDANLVFISRKRNMEVSVLLWHVVWNGKICLLPLKGTSSNWYKSVVINSKIKLILKGETFLANSRSTTQTNEVHKVIKLFKKKYSERVYKNFFHDDPDCAVMVDFHKE